MNHHRGLSDIHNHSVINAQKWDRRAKSFDEMRFGYFRWMQRQAFRYLDLTSGSRFLDVGCGTGYAVRLASTIVGEDGLSFGIDISPRMIEIASTRSTLSRKLCFEVANAEKLPFESDLFDAVLCTNSFHHYENPEVALSEIRRVLRIGGKVCIVDVTADNRLFRWLDSLVRQREPEHVRFYSTAEYSAMFGANDFIYITSRTISPPLRVHIAAKQ